MSPAILSLKAEDEDHSQTPKHILTSTRNRRRGPDISFVQRVTGFIKSWTILVGKLVQADCWEAVENEKFAQYFDVV